MNTMFVVIVLLVALRLMERAFDKSITPFDPFHKIVDWRRHFDRKRDADKGKDFTGRSYDAVAERQLRRLDERRRKAVPDNGLRRRSGDQ